jgi:hypothetical protein
MIVPLLATIGMLMFFRKKIAWWEYLALFGSSFIIILISKLIITTSMTSDTEYWSEAAYKIEYDGAWSEWVEKTCSYDCFCDTDDDGYETCMTCYEDCSERVYHSDHYRIIGKSGKSYSISAKEYNRIAENWGGDKRVGSHHGVKVRGDKGIHEAFFPKDSPEVLECIVTSHSYTNKVQAAHSVHEYPEVSESDVKKYKLYEYPEIYSKYKQKHILGAGDATQRYAEQNMDALNAELGPSKQCKAFIVIFKNQPEEAGKLQEAYWKGGNKNEFVMTIGVDDDNKVLWAHPFSWTENEVIKTTTQNFVEQQEYLELSKVSEYMHVELRDGFERKQFADFDYLTAEPTSGSIRTTMIILIIVVAGLFVWFILNRHDETVIGEYFRNLKNRDGYGDY